MESTHQCVTSSICKCSTQILKSRSIHLCISRADRNLYGIILIRKLCHFPCSRKSFCFFIQNQPCFLLQCIKHSPGSYLVKSVARCCTARHDHNIFCPFIQEKICHVAACIIYSFKIWSYTSDIPWVILDCLIVFITYRVGTKRIVNLFFFTGFDHILKPVCISGEGNDSLGAFCLGFCDKRLFSFSICHLSGKNKFHWKTFLNIIPVIICKHFHLC